MIIPPEQMRLAEERYQSRTPQRNQTLQNLESGSLMAANSPDRVEKRLKRLSKSPLGIQTLATIAETAAMPQPAPLGEKFDRAFERVLGENDLLNITYVDLARMAANAVGRVVIRNASRRVIGFGTGFLVSPRLLLTNNHVLRNSREAATSQVELRYQDSIFGQGIQSISFDFQPDVFFTTDQALDYSLVAIRDGGGNGTSLAAFGWLQLIEEVGKVLLGESLNIIQHPNGEVKQLALRENRLIDLLDDFLHYQTDTAPGSSGSPVFNDQWEVVGLHHSGVPRRDAEGNLLTRDGSLWNPEMGEQKIDWIANEGVRISQIVKHVKNRRLNNAQRRLVDDMLTLQPPLIREASPLLVPPPVPPDGNGNSAIVAVPDRDGVAVWTIPIQVSVRVGGAGNGSVPASPHLNGVVVTSDTLEPMPDELPVDDSDLQEALAALEAGRAKPYYDETADKKAVKSYYAGLPDDLTPAERYTRLHDLLTSTHAKKPKYKPAVQVYPWVDLRPDRQLRSIYSNKGFEPEELIREDIQISREHAARLREFMATERTLTAEEIAEQIDTLEASAPFNCEHVVPQSYFNKAEPMRGDLHHLFTCESDCNSFRANIAYFEFADFEEAVRTDCGKREANKFEPNTGKGEVARATLYFLLRYPGFINNIAKEYEAARIQVLLGWHKSESVTKHEKHRNQAIFEVQGNRNPLIDFPKLADSIDFLMGLG